jgi:hypothetical protein
MKVLIFFGGLFLMSSLAFTQDVDSGENLIQYDPLFWKDKLKLDQEQCQKIKEINSEYYESLFTACRQEKNDHAVLRSIANKSLQHRSQEIWDTFHPKQRKRWKRMWEASTPRERTNES